MDGGTLETPENGLQDGTKGISESSLPIDVADAKERAAIVERVRRKLEKKGITPAPLGKVVVSR